MCQSRYRDGAVLMRWANNDPEERLQLADVGEGAGGAGVAAVGAERLVLDDLQDAGTV